MRSPFLLALAVVLAGCLAPVDPGAAPAPDPSALAPEERTIPWSMIGCRFGVVLVDVPASAVEPFVPDGFRVLSVAQTGLDGQGGRGLPNPRGDGNLGLEVFECEGDGNGTTAYVSVFTGVEPPADLQRDVQNHFVKWDVLVPNATTRDLLVALGVPARSGNATVVTEGQGTVTSYEGRGTLDGIGEFQFAGRTAAPLSDGSFTEYTATPAGLVEWSMRYRLLAGGVGPQTVTVPDGAWFNDILPAGTHEGVGFSGVLDFFEGSILLPADR